MRRIVSCTGLRSVLMQDMLPTSAQHYDVAVLEPENILQVKDI